MKKILFTLFALTGIATASAQDASARLDMIQPDGSIRAVNLSDVIDITYHRAAGADASDGYSRMRVNTPAGFRWFELGEGARVAHTPVNKEAFPITNTDHEHCFYYMLYNFNDPSMPDCVDPDKPYGWRGSRANGPVFYRLGLTKGYDVTHHVIGEYTGKDYNASGDYVFLAPGELTKLYGIGVEAWTFFMPFEPVALSLTLEPKTTYQGQPFTGTYLGYELRTVGSRLNVKTQPVMTAQFLENGTYVLKSTDDNAIDVTDYFSYEEAEGTYAYVPEDPDIEKTEFDAVVTHSARGHFIDNAFAFIHLNNLVTGLPDDRCNYFVGKPGYSFVLASANNEGTRQLLQVTPDANTPRFWVIEDFGAAVKAATVQFKQGDALQTAPCVAIVSYDGQTQLKYELSAQDADPVISLKGKEAGIYAPRSGEGGQIELDGFGTAIISGIEYDYTAQDFVVNINVDGTARIVIVDPDTNYYSAVDSDVWDGPKNFICTTALGAYKYGEETTSNTIRLALDQQLNGEVKDGYAGLEILIARNDGFGNLQAVAATAKYEYDPVAKTITLTKVYVGTAAAGWTYANVVFCVSDDKQSVWLDDSDTTNGECIWATSRDWSYVYTGRQNTLNAVIEESPYTPEAE